VTICRASCIATHAKGCGTQWLLPLLLLLLPLLLLPLLLLPARQASGLLTGPAEALLSPAPTSLPLLLLAMPLLSPW
jgi:hypothetical protein